jgi:hypothetical protein
MTKRFIHDKENQGYVPLDAVHRLEEGILPDEFKMFGRDGAQIGTCAGNVLSAVVSLIAPQGEWERLEFVEDMISGEVSSYRAVPVVAWALTVDGSIDAIPATWLGFGVDDKIENDGGYALRKVGDPRVFAPGDDIFADANKWLEAELDRLKARAAA